MLEILWAWQKIPAPFTKMSKCAIYFFSDLIAKKNPPWTHSELVAITFVHFTEEINPRFMEFFPLQFLLTKILAVYAAKIVHFFLPLEFLFFFHMKEKAIKLCSFF